jgi:crotonobetainyl-CoA:carnitine CoA-transferase CaiB-like acyl-CoA transferase
MHLLADADILIENFKVGGLAKYGLDYASLSEQFPRLIYCSITGFGQDGPYAKRAGYDFIVQGMGGLMSVTGEPDQQPQKVGVAVTDIFTGLYASNAILAAVIHRDRTGRGQQIDMALLDVSTAIMANQARNYLSSGNAPNRLGNAHPNIVPYQVFDCSDGYINVAVGNDGQFRQFAKLLGREGLADDPDYATNPARLANRDALIPMLMDLTRGFSKSGLLAACEAAGVPAGPINNMAEMFDDPQVQARGMRLELDGVPSVRCPITLSGADLGTDQPSPALGEHQDLLKR